MKNTVKKLSTTMMLLVFALSNSLTTSCAVGNFDDLLAFTNDQGYTADRPILRGTAPTTMSLKGEISITQKNIPVSISLRDSDVKQVLRMFADKAGLNIIFKGDIDGKVTMDLVNVPLNSAFNMILETSDLNYSMSDKTLIITKSDDESAVSRQDLTVIPVKYVSATSIANFLNKNIYSMKKPGLAKPNSVTVNTATNEVIVMGSKNDAALVQKLVDQFDKKPLSASFKVNHTTPESMAKMVCSHLMTGISDKDADDDSDDDDDSDEDIVLGAGSIACTFDEDVETEEAEGNEALKSGKMTIAYYTQLGTVSVLGGSEQQIELVKEFIEAHDKRQPQAYLEISIIELNEDGSRTFNNQWSFTSKHFSVTADNQDGSGTSFQPFRTRPNGVSYGSGASLVYTVNYLLSNGKARTISNPRILVTNGQESTIDMTSDYVKTVTSQVVQGSLNATTQRQYEIGEDEGIKVTVTPFISPDGYVYLNMNPDYTVIKDQVTAVNAEATAALEGTSREGQTVEDLQATLLSRRNMELKNVRIKDGDTLVIAGMMREHETRSVNKVPILGDLPYIGTFFRSSTSSQEKSELVILVTPKIITESDDLVNNSL